MITLLIIETSTIVLICVIISAQLSSPPIGRLNFLVGWHPKVLTGTSLSANSLEKNDDWDYGCNYHVNGHVVDEDLDGKQKYFKLVLTFLKPL